MSNISSYITIPFEKTMESSSQPLLHDQSREATSSIRGYVYQVYQSILAWMLLNPEDVLYLEAAEDFDVHEGDNVTTTQVKETEGSGPITLRTPDVVETLNNYWRHRQNNADKNIRMRFLTTSVTTQEKGISFGEVGKGIDYWMSVARDSQLPLSQLQAFLLTLNLEETFKEYIRGCSEKEFRTVISAIQWDVGKKPKDGLISDIEERLILFGDRRGIDSLTSQRVLDSLLRSITDILCSSGNRCLTYVQFCESFDRATLEFMPKGEALALRSILAQRITGTPSQGLFPSQPILDRPLPLVRGASRRPLLVERYVTALKHNRVLILKGSTGLGKTSLASLVSNKIGGEWSWAGFRDRDPVHIADLLHRLAFEIRMTSAMFQVVLDDLDLGRVAKFESQLISLVFSIVNTGGLTLITSPSSCPPDLLNKLWLAEECDQEVPYLNDEDIAEIATLHGLKENQELLKWSRAIRLTTHGHPQLVHARIRNLQSKNWPPVEEYESWISGDDLEAERTASRRRLIDQIPDSARVLAYRLSLYSGRFSRDSAISLSQLPPPVALAGEAFDLLIGPWLEKLGEDAFRVSPLLQNQGGKVLSAVETKVVHEAIALEIMRKQALVPSDVGTILTHALAASSEQALVYLSQGIMFAKPEALQAIGDEVFWFPALALEPGQHVFRQNPVVELLLRLAQFRVAAASKQSDKANAIIDRTNELLNEENDEQLRVNNAVMAYSTFLSTIEIPIPPQKTVKMLSHLIDATQNDKKLQAIEQNFIEKSKFRSSLLNGLSSAQSLFTFEIARISGLNHLKDLLVALNNLDDVKRSSLLIPLETVEATDAELLINTAWWRDASNGALDVDMALSVLRFAVKSAQLWQAIKLERASYVAMAVVADEYGKNPQAALSILDEAECILGRDDARLVNQRAKILMKISREFEALPLFEKALASNTLPLVEQKFSARNAGIAAARTGDWLVAERFFRNGSLVKSQTKDMVRMSIGLLADAAFAIWKQGREVEALSLYAEVVKKLETIPINDVLGNRHLHAVIGHSLLWLSHAENAAQYNIAEPLPGVCSNQEPHEGFKDQDIKGIASTWGMLGSLDTKLATGLNLAQVAKERCAGKIPLLMEIDQRYSSYVALFKNVNVASAIRIFVEMYESLECKAPMEIEALDGGSTTEIPHLPSTFWATSGWRQNLLQRLLSVAVSATCYEPTSLLPIDSWLTDLGLNDIKGLELDRFFNILSGKLKPDDENLTEVVTWHIYRLREQSLSPQELFVSHFKILNYLTQGEWGNYTGDVFAKLVCRNWYKVTENQKFALHSPTYYVPLLRDKCEDKTLQGYSKVASVLEAAASATGVSLARSAVQYLSELKNKS